MTSYRPILIVSVILMPFLFFIGGPEHDSPRSIKHIWNFGHILYYALLPLTLIPYFNRKKTKRWHQIVIAIGLAVVLGMLMELFQSITGREFDLFDLIRNVIGALVSISFLLPIKNSIPIALKFITVAIVVVQCYPAAIALVDEHHVRRHFPIIADFQTPFQIHRWQGNADISVAKNIDIPGNHALQVDLTTDQYSGVNIHYFPPDWRRYKRLQFRMFNPQLQSMSITCRIHDLWHVQGEQRYHDRYSKEFSISAGWNTITIDLNDIRDAPRNRIMDLHRIHGIGFFSIRLPQPRKIFIDDLKLV